MTSHSKYSYVRPYSLRYKKARVLIGDRKDVRDCTFLVEDTILKCRLSQSFIETNGLVITYDWHAPEGGILKDRPVYFFWFEPLEGFWRRRRLELLILEILRTLTAPDLLAALAMIQVAGADRHRLWTSERTYLLELAKDTLANVGVPDLRDLCALFETLRPRLPEAAA